MVAQTTTIHARRSWTTDDRTRTGVSLWITSSYLAIARDLLHGEPRLAEVQIVAPNIVETHGDEHLQIHAGSTVSEARGLYVTMEAATKQTFAMAG